MLVSQVYRSCIVIFLVFQSCVDLVILDIFDFYIILGMTWSSPYHTILNCNAKPMTLGMLGMDRLEWEGFCKSSQGKVIYFILAKKLLGKGCLTF